MENMGDTDVRLKVAEAIQDDVNKGIVRIDYIYTGKDLYFLEVNTVPGMTAESVVPKQIHASGQTIGEILQKIISESIK